ncbi:hypothetical protein QU481_09995 [Crenobacter sp. SG2303]|uniref:DUF4175 domain-containing protein n=1 Tax=Crenobacter oryzisoli TaxID=3056844 RepID=A0ABT7XN93_9NEIS|nr:hypothetical protein [Crenobacter sp. SG2303]MDN0075220.1 hypothetical protein [Crenobacter sp. SG2303]
MSAPKYWFPAKRYGWGWGLPSTWQGWLVLGVYLVALIVGCLIFRPAQHPTGFIVFVVAISFLLGVVCY